MKRQLTQCDERTEKLAGPVGVHSTKLLSPRCFGERATSKLSVRRIRALLIILSQLWPRFRLLRAERMKPSFLLSLIAAGYVFLLGACNGFADTGNVPLDSAWQVESYRAGNESLLGALGIRSVGPARNGLNVILDMKMRDPNYGQAELLRYLEDIPSFARVNDLVGARITLTASVPPGFGEWDAPAGGQIFVESENADGIKARQYGPWTNLMSGPQVVSVSLTTPTGIVRGDYTDPGFDPERVIRCGIKVALNDRASRGFSGSLIIRSLRVDLAKQTEHNLLIKQIRAAYKTKTDDETLAKLFSLPALAPGAQPLPVTNQLKAGDFVRSINERPVPGQPAKKAWEVFIQFDEYHSSTAQRSARVVYDLPSPIDLSQKRVVAWAAVGPSLRGAITRPNLIQLELYDSSGRVLRGPAANCSKDGLLFSKDGRENASQWLLLEAAPISEIPLSLGYVERGFQASKVLQIGVRFELGKFSDVVRKVPYPAAGKLILSEFRVVPNPHLSPERETAATRAPANTKPVPIGDFLVGINYAFINYGWDVGQCPYGQRDVGGFSSFRQKLDRDFAIFRAHGVSLVRVFLLGDVRTGVVMDANGNVVGLDKYVAKDIDALISAAAKNEVKLLPVLIDFLAADGVSARDVGAPRWNLNEGEAPQLLVNGRQRRAFLEKALRPIVLQLAAANVQHPHLIYAIDIVNEIENARAVVTPGRFGELQLFIRQVRDLIRAAAPGLPVTLGCRNRDDLAEFWDDMGMDLWQYHYYDRMEEEEKRPLSFPASTLGLAGPVILGEVEPSDIEHKLDVIYSNGYQGALFWSYLGLDGFIVDLNAIKHWLDNKRGVHRSE